jgi:hypothetical protein
VDQGVDLREEEIAISNEIPVVRSARVASDGRTVRTVRNQDVGVVFEIEGGAPAGPDAVRLDLDVELAAATASGVDLVDGVPATTFRETTLTWTGRAALGVPFIIYQVDAAATDAEGRSVAYVCRLVVGDAAPEAEAPESAGAPKAAQDAGAP